MATQRDPDPLDYLYNRLVDSGGDQGAFAELLVRYEASGRFYHTLEHIEKVLRALDEWYPHSPNWLVLAAFYHDVVYDVTRHDNEEASASFAADRLQSVLGAETQDMVRAIEMTAGHDLSTLNPLDAGLLVGDLIGMACSVEEYRENSAKIRKEYAIYSDEEWATGRAAFIASFDARRILPHEERFDEAEARIHANMLDELTRL